MFFFVFFNGLCPLLKHPPTPLMDQSINFFLTLPLLPISCKDSQILPKYIHGSQRKDKYQIVGDTKSQELSVKIVTRVIHRIFFYILVQKGKYQSIVNSTRTKSNFKIPLPFHNRFYNCSEMFQIILLSNQYSHKCDIHSH